MDSFEDRPLERAPETDEHSPHPHRTRVTPLVLLGVVGLTLGVAAAWWWMRTPRIGPPPAASQVAGTDATVATPATRPPLPPLGQMDTFLRALLGTLSAHPQFAQWLTTDDLIRQMANAIDRVSQGQTPARELATFRPKGDFEVRRARNVITADAASHARYDSLAALVESLDAGAVVEVYRTIQPRLDEAYRALGRSEASVDTAAALALQTLIATPIPDAPLTLVNGKGATFAYADEHYEQLRPAQKQLLRMGPDNARRIQNKLREINERSGWR